MTNKRGPEGARSSIVDLDNSEFRRIGHELIDAIADFYESLPQRPITRGESPRQVRELLGSDGMPATGVSAETLIREIAPLVFDHSLHNGHPRFLGYITSSATPLGALADLLAASVNNNVGKWDLSPLASEIESQTVRWLADLVGFPSGGSGILSSGGNMANMLGFFAARTAQADWPVRKSGVRAASRQLVAYGSGETHTWIEKAADISGIGTDSIRWIETDADQRINVDALEKQIAIDKSNGDLPFIVVGTAGNVSTGAVDSLVELSALCRREKLWFHVDGAYGAPAAALTDASEDLKGLALADSVALDPHKWLYNPIEAGCTLVRNPDALSNAFSYEPDYYRLDNNEQDPGSNFYAMGMQNTRGFRALKVWLNLRHAGRDGYTRMIADDIDLARRLHEVASRHDELEAIATNLSITNFRFVPKNLSAQQAADDEYLNTLNRALVSRLQEGGELFVSNAIIGDRYTLRACVVNFRTSLADIEAIPEIVVRNGHQIHADLSS